MKRSQPSLVLRILGSLPKLKRRDALATSADAGRLRWGNETAKAALAKIPSGTHDAPKERRLKPFLINKASLRWLHQPTQVGFVL
jgi:hypothetical protein